VEFGVRAADLYVARLSKVTPPTLDGNIFLPVEPQRPF
jgi:hypothetical protein